MNLLLPEENKGSSPWLTFLAALFFWLFTVLFTFAIPLGLYGRRPAVTAVLLLLLATGGSFHGGWRTAREFPPLWRMVYIFLLQWGVAALWVMANRGEAGKPLLFSGRLITQYPQWWLLAVTTWFGAEGFGRMIDRLQRRPRRRVRTWRDQWDDDKVDLTLWNQTWRSLQASICGLLAAGVFLLAVAPTLAANELPRLLARGRLLLWLFSCAGFALLAAGNYCYQRACWLGEGLVPAASLFRTWRRQAGRILLLLSIPAWLFPGNFRAAGWRGVRWAVERFGLPAIKPPPLTGEVLPPPPLLPAIPVGAGVIPRLLEKIIAWLYLVTLICLGLFFAVLLLVLAGYLLHRLLAGQLDSLRGLPKALVRFYLFVRRLLARRPKPGFRRRLAGSARAEEAAGTRPHRKFYAWGSGPRALVRRGYYRLLRKACRRGLAWRASQTPAEIGQALAALLPEETAAVQGVTTGYQEARYGPVEPPKEALRRFEHWRRALEARLERRARN